MRSIAMLFDVVISTALIFGTEPWFAFIVSIVKHHEKNFSYNSFVLRVAPGFGNYKKGAPTRRCK
jgi:hypothetical protein